MSTPDGIPAEAPVRDVVSIRLPASGVYLAVLRTTTASLAARLDFTLDEIEDLRIAVDEASALLIAGAVEGADLTSVFEMSTDSIHISVSTMTAEGSQAAPRDSFAWTVLSALAGEVDAWTDPDGRQTISLVKHRSRDAT
ncbi:MAG TPA: anti-sigma regulatory factor [Acidothermaceae bacterium]